MSKDEKFSAKEELQKKVDTFNIKLGDLLTLKEKEISL
jgi:ribosome recycling factor